jgi:hypothetical protein
MPLEPKTEQLLTRMVARLSAIVAGELYWYTPGEAVARDWKNFSQVVGTPFYGVIEGESTSVRGAYPSVTVQQTVIVVVWVKQDVDRRTVLQRAVGDVLTALFLDPTFGGLAIKTDPPSVSTDEASFAIEAWAYAEITVTVHYSRPLGQP